MALFGNKPTEPADIEPQAMEQAVDPDTTWMDAVAGEGMDDMDASTTTTAYLAMGQPRGTSVASGAVEIGHFTNTGTGRDYGETVLVTPVGFKVIWNERDQLGQTVARYEPGSIEVREEPLPRGKRGYPKKINPASGNEVVETFMYAVIFPEYQEDGYAIFIPTKSSIKACRRWNTMLRSSRLPSGSPASLFSFVWRMSCERIDEGKPTDHVRLANVQRVRIIDKPLFSNVIEPARQIEMSSRLAIGAPEDDASAPVESTEY
jgi:hypothetical protein